MCVIRVQMERGDEVACMGTIYQMFIHVHCTLYIIYILYLQMDSQVHSIWDHKTSSKLEEEYDMATARWDSNLYLYQISLVPWSPKQKNIIYLLTKEKWGKYTPPTCIYFSEDVVRVEWPWTKFNSSRRNKNKNLILPLFHDLVSLIITVL